MPDLQQRRMEGAISVFLVFLCGLGLGYALGETTFPFKGENWLSTALLFSLLTLAFASLDTPGFMCFVIGELLGFTIHPWASVSAGLWGISTLILAALWAPSILRSIRPYLNAYYNY